MKRQHTITCLMLIVCTASGCSKFRQITRRDYASLRDPFATGLAADESTPPLEAAATTSGYVKIDDAQATEPKPATADYGAVAVNDNTTATTQRNDDGQFPGIKVQGMNGAVAAESLPENTGAELAQAESELRKQIETLQAAQSNAPADTGFADWASSKKERWKQEVAEVQQQVDTTQNHITQVSKTFEHAVSDDDDVASPLIRKPSESASPLIAAKPQSASGPDKQLLKLKPKAAQTAELPPPDFGDANPFAEMESASTPSQSARTASASEQIVPEFDEPAAPLFEKTPPAAVQKSTKAAAFNPFSEFDTNENPAAEKSPKQNTLDAGFNFDSGWRPADVQSP